MQIAIALEPLLTSRNNWLKASGPLLSVIIGVVLFVVVEVDAPLTSIKLMATVFPDDTLFEIFYSDSDGYSPDKSIRGKSYATATDPKILFSIPKSHRIKYRNIRFDFAPQERNRKLYSIHFFSGNQLVLRLGPDEILEYFVTNKDVRTFSLSNEGYILFASAGMDPYISTRNERLTSRLYENLGMIQTKRFDFLLYGFVIAGVLWLIQTYLLFLFSHRTQPHRILSEHRRLADRFFYKIEGSESFATLVLLGCMAVPACILYGDTLIFRNFYIFKDTACDTYVQFWPICSFISRSLSSGEIPFWSFNLALGTNLYPLWIFDPFLFFPLLAGEDVLPYLFGYAQLSRVLAAGLLFYAYLRTMGIGRYASIAGGILFAFSGYNVVRGAWWHYSTSVVSLAFLLLGFEQYFVKNREWILVCSITFFLVLHSFFWFHYSVILFFYALYRYVSMGSYRYQKFIPFFFRLGCYYLLGLGLGGVVLLPGASQVMKDPRFVGNDFSPYQILLSEILFRINDLDVLLTSFLQTLAPYVGFLPEWKSNHLESPLFYCGLLTLLIISQAFTKNIKGRTGYLALCILMAAYIIFPLPRYILMGFMGKYYKSTSLWVSCVMIFIAINLLQGFVNGAPIKYKPLHFVFWATVILLIGILAYFVGVNKYNEFEWKVVSSIIVFLLIYMVTFHLFIKKDFRNIAFLFLLVTIVGEVSIMYALIESPGHRQKVGSGYFKQRKGYADYTLEALDYIRSIDAGFYRIKKNYRSVYLNDAMMQDYFGTKSYYSANTQSVRHFIRELNITLGRNGRHHYIIGFRNRNLLDTLVGVRYLLSRENLKRPPQGYNHIKTHNGIHIYKNNHYLPIGFMYYSYMTPEVFRQLPETSKDLSLLESVVVDEDISGLPQGAAAKGRILQAQGSKSWMKSVRKRRKAIFLVTGQSHNRIKGTVETKKDGFLFFSIPFHPGWSAWVNGKRQNLHCANFGFLGLLLQKGYHRIELRYTPPFFWEGLFLTSLSLLLLLIICYCKKKKFNNSVRWNGSDNVGSSIR